VRLLIEPHDKQLVRFNNDFNKLKELPKKKEEKPQGSC
jgi:hypothetical protein